jgi:hypothetical protein
VPSTQKIEAPKIELSTKRKFFSFDFGILVYWVKLKKIIDKHQDMKKFPGF